MELIETRARPSEPFVDRREELRRLHELLARAGNDPKHHHVALVGLRRIGKSEVIKEFARRERPNGVLFVRLACDTATGDLDSWVRHFVRALVVGVDPTFDPDTQPTRAKLTTALNVLPRSVQQRATDLFDELDRKRPSWDAVLEGSLLLPQELATAASKRVVMALDEFPSVLKFRRRLVPAFDGIMRDVLEERSPSVLFVLAGSAVRQVRDVLEGDAPLLTRVDQIRIGLLDEASAAQLIDERLAYRGAGITPSARQELERFVGQHPYWTVRTIERAADVAERDGRGPIEQTHLETAIWEELIVENGPIAVACSWIWTHSLTRQAGDDRTLLLAISGFDAPVRRAELAAAEELKGWNRTKLRHHLGDLVRAGLLVEYGSRENAVIGFADPIFATWVMREGGQVAPVQKDIVATLLKQRERQADEHSSWYETYVRAVMDDFESASRWPGATFGPAAPQWVALPRFTAFEMNPIGPDPAQPNALDIYAQGPEPWLVEVKARQVKAAVKDVRRLKEKSEALAAAGRPVSRMWFVALNGFNPEAEGYARTNGIFITRGQQLQTMFVELQRRKKERAGRQIKPPAS